MDEVKWYENNSLESIKNIIKDNINTASRSFLAIGYYLKNVRDRKLYQQDGYQDIWEFAHAEFGISQSWASRYMSINDRFSKDGNSPMIQEEFQGFDKSKLSEMLTLTDEQLKQVVITTTVAQIKDMKKSYATSHKTEAESEKVVPAQLEPEKPLPSSTHGSNPTDIQKSVSNQELESIDFSRSIDSLAKEYEAKGSCPQGIGGCLRNGEEGEAGKKICLKCWKEWLSREKILVEAKALKEQEPQENVNDTQDTENDNTDSMDKKADIPERACSNCKYNILPREDYFKEYPDTDEFPCDKCDGDLNNWRPDTGIVTPDKTTEVVEAEVIQGDGIVLDCYNENEGCHKEMILSSVEDELDDEPEDKELENMSELLIAKELLRKKQSDLKAWTEATKDNRNSSDIRNINKLKVEIRAMATYICDLDNIVNPIPKPEQPELPILKNNDQRKDWAENYKAWGEWYYDQNIDCHYYKYDFPNGDRLIVEEYLGRENYWGKDKFDRHYFHLLQKEKLKYEKNKTYENKYEHDTSSMTEIVEYLKEFLKKG